jgi:hypothetical protein
LLDDQIDAWLGRGKPWLDEPGCRLSKSQDDRVSWNGANDIAPFSGNLIALRRYA